MLKKYINQLVIIYVVLKGYRDEQSLILIQVNFTMNQL